MAAANTANGDPAVGSTNVTAQTTASPPAWIITSRRTPFSASRSPAAAPIGGLPRIGGGRSDALQGGCLRDHVFGPAYIAGALAFTNHWFTTSRSALGDALTATFTGQSYGGRLEGGYRFGVLPTLGVTPYAACRRRTSARPLTARAI